VPGLTLVLDHAGKPRIGEDLTSWAAALRDLAARPNTVCKLSGLVTEAPPGAGPAAFAEVAEVVLSAFGAQRVMFGSDWPVCLLARDYVWVLALAGSLTAGLSPAERSAAFGETAARAYRLGPPASGTAGGAGGAGTVTGQETGQGTGSWH
jgi:L-fuconolactonase